MNILKNKLLIYWTSIMIIASGSCKKEVPLTPIPDQEECNIHCISFDQGTFTNGTTTVDVPLNQVNYGDVIYSDQGIEFRVKRDTTPPIPVGSSIPILLQEVEVLYANGISHLNFDQRFIFVSWKLKVQLDFTKLSFANKKVAFDIVRPGLININPFNVNEAGPTNLPSGIHYNYILLGVSDHGQPSYRVEITGNINTIEWLSTAYDNLCVNALNNE